MHSLGSMSSFGRIDSVSLLDVSPSYQRPIFISVSVYFFVCLFVFFVCLFVSLILMVETRGSSLAASKSLIHSFSFQGFDLLAIRILLDHFQEIKRQQSGRTKSKHPFPASTHHYKSTHAGGENYKCVKYLTV